MSINRNLTKTVSGSDNPTVKLMIVAVELLSGDEQLSRAGILLGNMLAGNQLNCQQIWLTNLLKCRVFVRKEEHQGIVLRNRVKLGVVTIGSDKKYS